MLTNGRILKAARALAGANQAEIAEAAGVSPSTIAAMEKVDLQPFRADFATVEKVRAALEASGVEFVQGGCRRRDA